MSTKVFRLDVSIEVDGFLLAEHRLDSVQELLTRHAPRWAAGLHVWRYRQQKTPVDVTARGALQEAVRARARERGPVFRELERRFGPSDERFFGTAELRGADASLIVVINVDENVLFSVNEAWLWGNSISIQICRRRVNGCDAIAWAARMFDELCVALSPPHGHAEMLEEYEAKNISHEGGGAAAIGVDYARALPGIYWRNFLGEPYCELIGRDRLLSAPAYEVKALDDGVLLCLHPDPQAWNTVAYKEIEHSVLAHVGPQYFFSRGHPNRKTIAPDFGLLARDR